MADNVAITAGAGTTIGTDEVTIGAVLQHVQRMKLVDGADGGTALIGGDATNGLDVDVTRLPAVTTVPVQITKTVAAAATPEALAADGTFFRSATIIASKAARVLNTGLVYLGIGATNDASALELSPGDVYTITAPLGQQYDLNDWYLDVVTAADGVVVIYS